MNLETPKKKRKNSRAKGGRGERDLCAFLKSLGHSAERTQQYCGNSGEAADIRCELLKDFHVECKRTENVNLYKAYSQAVRDSEPKVGYSMFGPDGLPRKTPIVFHRKNRGRWMVFMDAEKFIELVSELMSSKATPCGAKLGMP